MTLINSLKKAGGRFAFFFFLEVNHDQIVDILKEYLKLLGPDDVRNMVQDGKYPSMGELDFSTVTDFADYFQRVNSIQLMEWIADARPDLAQVIMDMGEQGAQYIVKLRQLLLDMVRHPEKAIAGATDYKPTEETVLLECEHCHKQVPVAKSKAASFDKCPFCGE